MPRSILVLLFLILGCVIALAVAAIRSLAVDYSALAPVLVTDAEIDAFHRDWTADRPAGFPEVSEFSQIDAIAGVGITIVGIGTEDQSNIFRLMRVRVGWPLKCFEGDDWNHTTLAPDTSLPGAQMIVGGQSTYRHLAIVLPDQIPLVTMSRGKFLPYGVVWGGLAANTLVYAVALFAMYAGFIWMRTRRRMGEGCCRACGYQLKELTRCPECGKAAV